jgi:hypothetical protein
MHDEGRSSHMPDKLPGGRVWPKLQFGQLHSFTIRIRFDNGALLSA